MVDRFLALPPSWHRSKPTGELLANAGGDAEAATDILAPLPWATGVLFLLVFLPGNGPEAAAIVCLKRVMWSLRGNEKSRSRERAEGPQIWHISSRAADLFIGFL